MYRREVEGGGVGVGVGVGLWSVKGVWFGFGVWGWGIFWWRRKGTFRGWTKGYKMDTGKGDPSLGFSTVGFHFPLQVSRSHDLKSSEKS